MLVDLEKIPPEGQAIDRSVDPSTLSFDAGEFQITNPLSLRGSVTRADSEAYRLQGDLACVVEVSCARCLEPLGLDIGETLDLLYLPQSKNVAPTGEPNGNEDPSLSEDELAVSFYKDDEIDLAHMIWEQITLALPMKPVCKPECQGLCPGCGVNRNETTCSCAHDTTDPRWESLKTLLGR